LADANGAPAGASDASSELRQHFHQLNNQLSVVLAHAELLESKAVDGYVQSRASQIVTSALGAMTTVKAIRDKLGE
jgi:hypothetical protein